MGVKYAFGYADGSVDVGISTYGLTYDGHNTPKWIARYETGKGWELRAVNKFLFYYIDQIWDDATPHSHYPDLITLRVAMRIFS